MKTRLVSVILLLILASLALAEETNPSAADFWGYLAIPRVWMTVVFALVGLGLLLAKQVTLKIRVILMFLTLFAFTVLYYLPLGNFAKGMGLHPSPMCVMTKPFLFINADRAIPAIFIILFSLMILLTILGKKLFCGWACPLGALQELVYRIPLPRQYRQKLPFMFTNFARMVAFVLFWVVVLINGRIIYDYFNPFESLHWDLNLQMSIVLLITLLAALFTYRPFCYVLCPIGLWTWFAEHISIYKVKVDDEKCTKCNICVVKSPCPTVTSILEHKKLQPDCHACGRCIEVCPEDALKWRR